MGRRVEESVSAVEAAIRGEKSARLGATGEELEKRLARLSALRAAYAAAPEAERPAIRAAHDELRAEAERLRWNLTVQREAMGLTRHQDLDTFYPLPRRLE